jgi:hypothetical protein
VRRIDEEGRHFMLFYEGEPIPVAVGHGGATVAFEMPYAWFLYHAETGAMLHRFQR